MDSGLAGARGGVLGGYLSPNGGPYGYRRVDLKTLVDPFYPVSKIDESEMSGLGVLFDPLGIKSDPVVNYGQRQFIASPLEIDS